MGSSATGSSGFCANMAAGTNNNTNSKAALIIFFIVIFLGGGEPCRGTSAGRIRRDQLLKKAAQFFDLVCVVDADSDFSPHIQSRPRKRRTADYCNILVYQEQFAVRLIVSNFTTS